MFVWPKSIMKDNIYINKNHDQQKWCIRPMFLYTRVCVYIYIFTQLLQLTFKYGSKLSFVGAKWKMFSYDWRETLFLAVTLERYYWCVLSILIGNVTVDFMHKQLISTLIIIKVNLTCLQVSVVLRFSFSITNFWCSDSIRRMGFYG